MFAWLLAHKVVGNKIHRKHSFVVELSYKVPQLGLKETGDVKGFWCPQCFHCERKIKMDCVLLRALSTTEPGKPLWSAMCTSQPGWNLAFDLMKSCWTCARSLKTIIRPLKMTSDSWGQIFSSNICIRVHHNSCQVTFNNPGAWNFLLEY